MKTSCLWSLKKELMSNIHLWFVAQQCGFVDGLWGQLAFLLLLLPFSGIAFLFLLVLSSMRVIFVSSSEVRSLFWSRLGFWGGLLALVFAVSGVFGFPKWLCTLCCLLPVASIFCWWLPFWSVTIGCVANRLGWWWMPAAKRVLLSPWFHHFCDVFEDVLFKRFLHKTSNFLIHECLHIVGQQWVPFESLFCQSSAICVELRSLSGSSLFWDSWRV
jgi:hypothetical protein